VPPCQLVEVADRLVQRGGTLDNEADLSDPIGDSGDLQIAIMRKGQSGSGVPIRGSLVNCGDLTLVARSLLRLRGSYKSQAST
jgi:hypothetical protein